MNGGSNYSNTLLEDHTYIPGLIFYLYRVFLPTVQVEAFVPVGATTQYNCPLTGTCWGLLLLLQYKYEAFVPGSDSARYKCSILTFVSGE
jgi:hypothetical protein